MVYGISPQVNDELFFCVTVCDPLVVLSLAGGVWGVNGVCLSSLAAPSHSYRGLILRVGMPVPIIGPTRYFSYSAAAALLTAPPSRSVVRGMASAAS